MYYTRGRITEVLCGWAIRTPDDLVLEPSFGGCDFLESARGQLKKLGASAAIAHLYGCDTDRRAFAEHLVGGLGVPAEAVGSGPGDGVRFLEEDFLSLTRGEAWPVEFDVVVGNPPYVRHHELSEHQRSSVDAVRTDVVGGRANLWASFVVHAHSFLGPGGRAAWVLPGAALQADYARAVLDQTGDLFGRTLVVELGERLFEGEGAVESTVVLLAEGYRAGSSVPRVARAETIDDLEHVMSRWRGGKAVGAALDERPARALLPPRAFGWVERIEASPTTVLLGDVATVRIGVVTGANAHFVLDHERAFELGLPERSLHPLLPKSAHAPGLFFEREDHARARAAGSRCLLFTTDPYTHGIDDEAVDAYVAEIERNVSRPNRTFEKRTPWHRVLMGSDPDAFLTYMAGTGPRVVVNRAGATSTNSTHRLYVDDDVTEDGSMREALAVALASTYGQLAAELEGRSYGDGVLKLEPSDARRLRLPIARVGSATVAREVDRRLRVGDAPGARRLADDWIMRALSDGEQRRAQADLESALTTARRQRRRPTRC